VRQLPRLRSTAIASRSPAAAHLRAEEPEAGGLPLKSIAIAAALLFASCATLGIRGKADTSDALRGDTAAIWTFYGGKGDPPTVLVVEPEESDCTAPTGFPGFSAYVLEGDRFVRACREGFTLLPGRVSVVRRPDMRTSALRHEIMHARMIQEGVIDPNHERAEWQPGGMVDRARDVMSAP
jgi:hypothetical protein